MAWPKTAEDVYAEIEWGKATEEDKARQLIPAEWYQEAVQVLTDIARAGNESDAPTFELWADRAWDHLPSAERVIDHYEREVR
jgi:hypothetical protein